MCYLFAFDSYYPEGGMNDFEGVYSTVEEAEKAFDEMRYKSEWGQIVVFPSGKPPRVVKELRRNNGQIELPPR